MKREISKQLLNWKQSSGRKPLILQGARQVGKTFSLKEFGKSAFRNFHYINFDEDRRLSKIFESDLKPSRIINDLRFHLNCDIDITKDLVIFDEIQQCGRALGSLKYFCEDLPELCVCAAGSLLGLSLSSDSFPVGKVSFLDLYPMSFSEFIDGIGESILSELLETHDFLEPYPSAAHERLWELWKHYLIVGGLPAAVKEYNSSKSNLFESFNNVRKLQNDLISAYCSDIAKHSGKTNAIHVEQVWRNVPQQLARTVDGSAPKFRFKDVISTLRGFDKLCGPINWLRSARLVLSTSIVEKAEMPLSAYASENSFKLYFFDAGMLGAISELPPAYILDYGFGSYKGYIAENFVAQELLAAGVSGHFCWKGRTSEIEFLIPANKGIYPLEVKSGTVIHSKSLDVFIDKHKPEKAFVLSGRNSEKRPDRAHVPLYAAARLAKAIQNGNL